MRDVLAREHPDAVVSISSEVLREYREYERAVTTLVDAAVKPNIRRYVANIAAPPGRARRDDGRTDRAADRRMPFYVMKSNGGVLSAEEVVDQPITTVLSGPAAGALGAAVVARGGGLPAGGHLRRRRYVDRRDRRDRRAAGADHRGQRRRLPEQDPDDRRGHRRRRRRVDRVDLARRARSRSGRSSAGADPGPICYGKGGTEPTITDAHVLLGRIPPHLLGGEVPLDVDLAAQRHGRAGRRSSGSSREACATGVLEISAWNQANALRQVTVKRGLDVRDFTMVTFGGSGSLLACRLVDILGLDGVLVPLNPGNLSAYGLLTVDVRNDYVQTAVAKASRARRRRRAGGVRRPGRPGRRGAGARGVRGGGAGVRAHRRPALLRAGLRGPRRRARRPGHRRPGRRRSPTRSTTSTGRSTATTSATTRGRRSSG